MAIYEKIMLFAVNVNSSVQPDNATDESDLWSSL